jgi:rare lipoprotein A
MAVHNRIVSMPNQKSSHSGCSGPQRIASAEITAACSKAIQDVATRVSGHAFSTARIIIGAEELLRQRARSVLRVAIATVFFAISGLISMGANVTTAFAKKVSLSRGSHGQTIRLKRADRSHSTSLRYRHRARPPHLLSHARKSKLARNSMLRPADGLRGQASWYGKEFHNRQTASGARFNTHAMTAAHRTLPFGTRVRVTNLENAKSCIVEITDRGPFAKGRIIDLSYAAAEDIGMRETGVANVKIEVLRNRLAQPAIDDIASLHDGPILDRIPRASSVRALASLVGVPAASNPDDLR